MTPQKLYEIYITYMADHRHNRKDESRFRNRLLPRLSYKKKPVSEHLNHPQP
ncbi:hypothetical protein MTBBW1_350046 [Desulfamplus magnetovallimortis]|uniref:Uncharacterized protein n=1 Tax=Desulfamplus magnetovallimortis TaxID=1246637 RepID=A0A1W1HGN0_9BACT|nr:hypothetical protein MTBBW1_350046 [Desulfamplus magnetovallimortis]